MPKNKPIGVYFLSIIVLLGAIYTIIIFLPYLSLFSRLILNWISKIVWY